jgi:hypothetical protein
MKTLVSIVSSLVVAAALLAPLPAHAQRRAPDDGGGSEGRTAGGRSSDSESSSERPYRPESPPPSASPRSNPEPVRVQSQPARRVTGAPAAGAAATSTSGRRIAGERPAVGIAGPRRPGDPVLQPIRVIYSPVYLSSVFGYGPWGYSRYGYGYGYGPHWGSPFSYGYYPGYGYSHYYYGYPGYYGSGYADGGYDDEQGMAEAQGPSGSVRFRVSPSHAQIYIDGALAGTVDDFDGLSNHLRLSAGAHAYELRADGYRSHVGVLTVVAGQTRTERVNLERAQ